MTVLHVTDGAPPDLNEVSVAGFKEPSEYAEALKHECLSALAIANVPEDRVVELDLADHCAAEWLTELTRKIAAFLQKSAADIIVTHPYEGGHPDHDATAFATHSAIRLMEENGLKPPVLFEMALHPSSDFQARVPEFLPGQDGEVTTLRLDEQAMQLKQRMLECFVTQRESMQISPVGPERFRKPQPYNFAEPPCDGRLHYEHFDWTPSVAEWQSLANKALIELFPQRAVIAKSTMQ